MTKKEIIWILATLAVTVIAWVIYCSFIEEEYVEPGAAANVELVEDEVIDTTGVQDHGMDLSQLPSVGDEDE